ncbi:hypothetical protein CQW23_24517 [Capsicum baccatum]|uniref:GRF-type domain-containing protein n=1 Tax=Capsicum baccatum TaxID=33114 RepID=A0A2G2VV11_CAPBA|nr:hypothetical protein CQW23_24517 [Capsicum baccatum]
MNGSTPCHTYSIAKKFGEKFKERHAFVGDKENIILPSAERILRDNKSVSHSLYVGNPNGVLDEYTVFGNGVTAKVNLLEKSHSCRKFNLVKIPCEHAMTALRAKYGDGEDYGNSIYGYSLPIYKAESYLLAYSEAINVVPPEAEWTVPQELIDTKISLPPYDPKLGRKKVKRTKSVGETFKSKRRNRCSISVLRTSRTDSNPGRKFYNCAIAKDNDACSFSKWLDELSPPSSPSTFIPDSRHQIFKA